MQDLNDEDFDLTLLAAKAGSERLDEVTDTSDVQGASRVKKPYWNPLNFDVGYDTTIGEVDVDCMLECINDAKARLKKYGLKHNGVDNWKVIGFEAGDDRVDFSANPLLLSLMISIQEKVFLMKTSENDTFISNSVFNFCEVTTQIPSARQQSLAYAKKSNFKTIGFIDSPPLRIIMDVRKGDMSHSSTAVGKATMLGLRKRDAGPKHKLIMEIASFIQDGCLSVHTMDEPKFIPIEMGGCGVEPPWGLPSNLYLYLKAFKRGTYDRVYGSSTNEAYTAVRSCDRGVPSEVYLCNRLRDRQEYLWGTYAQYVFIPPTDLKPKEGMPPPIYKAIGTRSGVSGVERRLTRLKLLLPESLARMEYDRNCRVTNCLLGAFTVKTFTDTEKRKSTLQRKNYGFALKANSAFQNLLNRQADGSEVQKLLGAGFIGVTTGALHFSRDNAKWVANGCKGEIYSLSDIPRSENMYIRSEVSKEKTMKVPGLSLRVIRSDGIKTVTTVSKLGLWQISETMEEWGNQVLNQLLQQREVYQGAVPFGPVREIFYRNPEWVSDDSMLTARIANDHRNTNGTETILLLGNDKRLARQLSQTLNIIVVLLHPFPVAMHMKIRVWSAETVVNLQTLLGLFEPNWFSSKSIRDPIDVYIDSGSVSGCLKDIDQEPEFSRYYRETLISSVDTEEIRGCTVLRTYLDDRALSTRVAICWPNTVFIENPLFMGDKVNFEKGRKGLFGNMKAKLKKFSH